MSLWEDRTAVLLILMLLLKMMMTLLLLLVFLLLLMQILLLQLLPLTHHIHSGSGGSRSISSSSGRPQHTLHALQGKHVCHCCLLHNSTIITILIDTDERTPLEPALHTRTISRDVRSPPLHLVLMKLPAVHVPPYVSVNAPPLKHIMHPISPVAVALVVINHTTTIRVPVAEPVLPLSLPPALPPHPAVHMTIAPSLNPVPPPQPPLEIPRIQLSVLEQLHAVPLLRVALFQ